MKQQILPLGENPSLLIEKVPGDLRITGWERSELKAKTNGNALEITQEDGQTAVSCDSDLIISLPQDTSIVINNISGDASLRVLNNSLQIGNIAGDLALRNIGQATLEKVSGDFVVRHASGGVQVAHIGGDASLREVNGDVILEKIGSGLHLRGVQGNISAHVGDDAVLFIEPQAEATYNIQAGSDIMLRLSPDADVELTMTAETIAVNLPNMEAKVDESPHTLALGSGSAKMTLTAGEDLSVTSRVDAWQSLADFDISLPFIGADFPGLADDFGESLSRKMDNFGDDFAEHFSHKMDEATRKMDEKLRHADRKMRHAEQKARKADRHAEKRTRHAHFSWVNKQKRTPPSEPVSEDERLLILQMLQEKKISADDAEKLLSALE